MKINVHSHCKQAKCERTLQVHIGFSAILLRYFTLAKVEQAPQNGSYVWPPRPYSHLFIDSRLDNAKLQAGWEC